MKSAFCKSLLVLWSTLFPSSCVVMQENVETETRSERTCQVSVTELCSFRTWEKACQACDSYRFLDDLVSSEPLGDCSRKELCDLCQAGFSVCDYPRSEWRFEFRPGPPPPPHRPPPRHRRGRPDDFPKR